jgi:ADP-ribosylglycohydrolase
MLGAITGDIVGSVYEWHNIKTKDFPPRSLVSPIKFGFRYLADDGSVYSF